ncbi:MAG: citrate lyase subunit beta, partial [Propionibacteriaceae bacterium]|nr:citrate lyase subunit beta [Propionibacteriaceae bacterium]
MTAVGKFSAAPATVELSRSMMFIPASRPGMLSTARVYGADKYMFDLEDAVSVREKDSARILAYHALRSPLWADLDVVVRVNGTDTPFFRDDVEAMVRGGAACVRLPMVSTPAMVEELDALVTDIESRCGREAGSTKLMAAIESAAGVVNANAIAQASPRLVGLALAGFDYLLDMGSKRTKQGMELFYARCAVLHAARANGLSCYD